MSDNSKCAILVPVAQYIEPATEAALNEMQRRGYVVPTIRGGSAIDLVRSCLATQAYIDGFEETMWIDADIEFQPDQVEQLRSLDLPFSAGAYTTKGTGAFAGKLKPGRRVKFGRDGGVTDAFELVGMGFTHVRRCVYEKVAEGLPACNGGYFGKRVAPLFLPMTVPDGDVQCYLPEDYAFCYRATQAGFPPVVDTRIKLGHVGKKAWTWDDLVPQAKLDAAEVEQNLLGHIRLVGGNVVGIGREELQAELENLRAQIERHRADMEQVFDVRAAEEAKDKYRTTCGAYQMVEHLLKRLA